MTVESIMRFSKDKTIIQNVAAVPNHVVVTFVFMEDNTLTTRQKHLAIHVNRLELFKSMSSAFNPTDMEKCIREFHHWVYVEQRVRTAMRNLVRIWLHKKYKSRHLNEEDPWTLSKPEKCISVFDVQSRGLYRFEASSLKKQIESSLGYSEWAFPRPSNPKNPCTNIPFHNGQLLKIMHDIRMYGIGSWMMEAFLNSKYNLIEFCLENTTVLKIHALKQIIKEQSAELIAFMDDFIDEQHTFHCLTNIFTTSIIKWALRMKFNDVYIQAWIQLFYNFMITKYKHLTDDCASPFLAVYNTKGLELIRSTHVIMEYTTECMASLPVNLYEPLALNVNVNDNLIVNEAMEYTYELYSDSEFINNIMNGNENENENVEITI